MLPYARGIEAIGLIRRVPEAAVRVDGRIVGEIGPGLLALVCTERGDTAVETDHPLKKLLSYRISSDVRGKMNPSVYSIGSNGQAGGLPVISQFMLAADAKSDTRPNFTPAAMPEDRRRLYKYFVACARAQHLIVATGEFGAGMRVSLVNDGPVVFWLQIAPQATASVTKTAAPETVKPVRFVQKP